MAGIRENKRNGKVVSYRFTACLDRDANGKQVRKYRTWPVPDGLTTSKAKKAAQRAADEWEQQERKEYQKELELGQAYILPPEKRRDSFSSFVNDVWFPLYVCSGEQMTFIPPRISRNGRQTKRQQKIVRHTATPVIRLTNPRDRFTNRLVRHKNKSDREALEK